MGNEGDHKPTLDELRAAMQSIKPSGEFNITPSVTAAIPTPKTLEDAKATLGEATREVFPGGITDASEVTPEDIELTLSEQAKSAFDEELRIQVDMSGHNKLLTKRGRFRFIRNQLGYRNKSLAKALGIKSKFFDEADRRLANYLGISVNQVEREDLRGTRSHKKGASDKNKPQQKKFDQRFNGLFTLASIMDRYIFEEDVLEKRVTLGSGNSRISNMSLGMALRGGYPNIAVSIALDAIRQKEDTIGMQEELD